jgi:hypothetical protein
MNLDTGDVGESTEPQLYPQELLNQLVPSNFSDYVNSLRSEFDEIDPDRLNKLISSGAKALGDFFSHDYGKITEEYEHNKPRYWPYVRHMTYEILRPLFNDGETQFANRNYSDKFLQDIVDEAHKDVLYLPSDIKPDEWLFFSKLCS